MLKTVSKGKWWREWGRLLLGVSRPVRKRKRRVLKASSLCCQGDHHDLQESFHRINTLYFGGELDLPIGWFGSKRRLPQRQVRFGYYHQRHQWIRIHRLLDQAHVPSYFVDFIVYHEMLHHVLPPIQKLNKRRQIHHAAFLKREKQFQEYTLAQHYIVKRLWRHEAKSS